MSTTNGGAAVGAQAEAAPQLNVLAQYVKDLSFENPNAPRSLQQQQGQPSINIQINVNAKPLSGNEYEIELKIEGRAEVPGANPLFLFGFDLLYAGVFRIVNVPQENLHPVIMIECPRLLFPFARELIATAVRNGGFPPLMIDPVDFVSLYRQKVAESQPQSGTATA
jgi:preprotein translocase subunit SecB